MLEHAEIITDLLLGAAHADDEFVGHEVVEIRAIVSALYGQRVLPPERVEQIKSFDPASFDVEATASKLADLSRAKKMKILALINEVVDSDGVLDMEEDVYLARAAAAMGLAAEAGESLILEVVDDEPPAEAPAPATPPPLKND